MKIPPVYSINAEVVELIAKIDASRQLIISLSPSPQIIQKIQRVSLLKSSLFSARIEGNSLSLENLNGIDEKKEKKEITNILETSKYLQSEHDLKAIDLSLIKNLHQLVMNNLTPYPGNFRKEMSAIFNQTGVAIYVPPPPTNIFNLINQLIKFINSKKERFPLIAGFLAHLVFEKIHPFIDGNGRVGRLLISAVFKVYDYDYGLVVPFEEYLDEHKSDYYYFLNIGLKQTNDYLLFMLKAFYRQTEKIIGLLKSEMNNKNKVYLPPRQEEIFQIIKEHHVVSFDFIKRRFLQVPVRTLRWDLKKLVGANLIVKIGKTRGSYYSII